MRPEYTLLEFLEDAADDCDCDVIELFEEWFATTEEDFHIWTALYSGWIMGKGYDKVEITEGMVEAVGAMLIGSSYATLH